MAQQIGRGSKLPNKPVKPRRQFLPEASAVSEAARQILTQRFGAVPWIEQVCTGIREAVQNGIENLSGTNISSNAHPQDGYKFRARTKDELVASQQLVAPTGGRLMPKPPVEAANGEWVPPPEDVEAASPYGSSRIIITDKAPPPPKAPKGWII